MIHARLNDVSTGGMNVLLPKELPPGSFAMIGLRVPGREHHTVWFRSRLRHRAGFRCGFQFMEISSEQRTALRELGCGLD